MDNIRLKRFTQTENCYHVNGGCPVLKEVANELQSLRIENLDIKDKLSRRNKLIAYLREEHKKRGEKIVELSKELQKAYVTIADLTHPEYKDK